MKRNLCAMMLVFLMVSGAWAEVAIDAAHFPDDTFRSYVSSNFDTDSDGVLSDAEIAGATGIYVSGLGISSLQGLEYFTALTVLWCSNNQLTALDVTSNTALEILHCEYNYQIAALDLSNNTALTELCCDENQISALDTSNSPSLTHLSCFRNYQLSTLNVSNNIALTYLSCYQNNLATLDVSNNTALTKLACSGNLLATLDLSSNTALDYLSCRDNQLTALDLSNNTALAVLSCKGNRLAALDIGGNTTLTYLSCSSQGIPAFNITSSGNISYPWQLDLTDYMTSAQTANVSNVQGVDSSGMDIDTVYSGGIAQFVSSPTAVRYNYNTGYSGSGGAAMTVIVSASGEAPSPAPSGVSFVQINSETFPDDTFRAYISSNFDTNSDGSLSAEEIANATNINVRNSNISSLKGIEYFTSLKTLDCWENNLTSLDVSNNIELVTLSSGKNSLFHLDVSNNTKLEELDVWNNSTIQELDVSNNPLLIFISCGSNKISALDLTNNTALEYLGCDHDSLAALDLGGILPLWTLYCNTQKRDGLTITSSGNTSYPYQLNFTDYMTSAQTANISGVQGLDSDSNDIATTYSGGVAMFASSPAKVTYNYATGYTGSGGTMDVTISDSVPYYEASDGNSWETAYVITSVADMLLIQERVKDGVEGTGKYYKLSADLDMTSVTDWYGIGRDNDPSKAEDEIINPFTGHFDGQNHTIMVNFDYASLFGAIRTEEGTIAVRNLNISGDTHYSPLAFALRSGIIENCTFTGSVATNGIIDSSGLISFMFGGTVRNCTVTADISSASGSNSAGGIAAFMGGGTITDCTVKSGSTLTATHSSADDDSWGNAGGIVGFADGGTITNCIVEDGVSVTGSRSAGGILGFDKAASGISLSGNTWPSSYQQVGNVSSSGVAINATNFPDSAFRSYVSNNFDTDNDGFLSGSEIASAENITVNSSSITTLKGIEHFYSLKNLICGDNPLISLDISANTALNYLNCWNCGLTQLDLSQNTALVSLDCYGNALTALDLTNNTALVHLACKHNEITTLNISANTSLTYLECSENRLTDLDVKNNTALREIWCFTNRLTALDVSKNTALEVLVCGDNSLTALDVSSNTALTNLNFWANRLTSINLSSITALRELYFYSNDITAVDLSRNTELVSLDCNQNKLMALDLTNNTKLVSLHCGSNCLRTLDVSSSAPITDLYCGNQSVQALKIYSTGDSSYPYQVDFSDYVSSDKSAKLSSVKAYDSSNAEIQTVYENGIARFASRPARITYSYDTGLSSQPMSVNIGVTSDTPVVDIDNPTPSPLPESQDIAEPVTLTLSSHKYTLFNVSMTWDDAKAECESMGGHLATITSQAEQDVIETLLLSGDKYAYWLGGHQDNSGTWSWVDGRSWNYSNWASGQPDGSGNYLHIYGETPDEWTYSYDYVRGRWDDAANDASNAGLLTLERHGFICEWEPVEAKFAPINADYTLYETNPDAYFDDSERLGYIPSTLDFSHLADNPPVSDASVSAVFRASASAADSRYDPRQNGRNFRARYQGDFGTCWAHAALGALEASYTVQGLGNAPDLSRLHMAWFVNKDATKKPKFGTHQVLDQGGTSEKAINFLKRAGTAYERDLPYPQNQAEAEMSRLKSLLKGNPEDYSSIVTLDKAEYLGATNRLQIKEAILSYGTVAISYNSNLQYYNGDSYYYKTDSGFGHMVDIVGWDDNYSRENFAKDMRPSSNGAWLIKDSKPRHSNTGYFWMSYEQTIGTATTFVASEDILAFKVYGHDTTDSSSSINYHWSANIFRAEASESIRKIGIETRDNNTEYAIYINRLGRTKPSGPGTPRNPEVTGREPGAGYHIISLTSPVDVAGGEYFSVIMRVSNSSSSSYRYYSAVEDTYSIRGVAVISPNESYFARNEAVPSQAEWVDGITLESSDIGRACNARLTAYSVPAEKEPELVRDYRDEDSNASSGGGCVSGAIPAFIAAVIIAFTALRKKH